ncbi:TPA: FtsX-like permease family protein [Candidatus Poribacteria bacterium]|nr:FtsX-like permease family protein [Candidatus Poribacteria bacterium]
MLILILKEIAHRKANFLLSLFSVIIAVAMFVSFFTIGEASKRETNRLMREIGFNLRIIPKDTDMTTFWTVGFSQKTMPHEYINHISDHPGISYEHLTAALQRRVRWKGIDLILTGFSSSITGKKQPMVYEIESGKVHVGYEIAKKLNLKRGQEIKILGHEFLIERCLPESGSTDDIRVQMLLSDTQKVLGLQGKINEIRAIDCLCLEQSDDAIGMLRSELERILPTAKVTQVKAVAKARNDQRKMANKYFVFIIPIVVIGCVVWMGIMMIINVRDRSTEIGVMRALGYGAVKISSLFLGKSVIIGLIGALFGFLSGTGLALQIGPEIFKLTANQIHPMFNLLAWSILIAPVFSAFSSFIPTMIAVAIDPAISLRQN